MVTKPKIAEPVPLEQLDSDRFNEYRDLSATPPKPGPVPVSVAATKELDEDKKEFVRAILGNVPFGKKYMLYGVVEAVFLTRPIAITEKMYDELRGLNLTTTEEWNLWLARFKLLSTLSQVNDKKNNHNLYAPPKTVLEGSWQHGAQKYLLSLSPSLYEALLNASSEFESYTQSFIEQASQPDFWQTVGRI